jgi:hypothetical protein
VETHLIVCPLRRPYSNGAASWAPDVSGCLMKLEEDFSTQRPIVPVYEVPAIP